MARVTYLHTFALPDDRAKKVSCNSSDCLHLKLLIDPYYRLAGEHGLRVRPVSMARLSRLCLAPANIPFPLRVEYLTL